MCGVWQVKGTEKQGRCSLASLCSFIHAFIQRIQTERKTLPWVWGTRTNRRPNAQSKSMWAPRVHWGLPRQGHLIQSPASGQLLCQGRRPPGFPPQGRIHQSLASGKDLALSQLQAGIPRVPSAPANSCRVPSVLHHQNQATFSHCCLLNPLQVSSRSVR